MVSSIEHQGRRINDDHDERSNLLRRWLQCNDIADAVDIELLEVTAIANATTHRMNEEPSSLEEFLRAQASDC